MIFHCWQSSIVTIPVMLLILISSSAKAQRIRFTENVWPESPTPNASLTPPKYLRVDACDWGIANAQYQNFSELKPPPETSGPEPLLLAQPSQLKFDNEVQPNQQPDLTPLRYDVLRPWIGQRFLNDTHQFYRRESVVLLTYGFLAGAVAANTNLDQYAFDSFQDRVTSSNSWSRFFHNGKELGNGYFTIPIYVLTWGVGSQFPDSPFLVHASHWSERTVRGFVVGAIPIVVLQGVTGGSRPSEGEMTSRWQPFQDNNGVSGHSFVSALPFITAAKMTDSGVEKALWYAGSAIGPLSRVNDRAHYPSQAFLGWWVAYVAASAVQKSEIENSAWRLTPYSSTDSVGIFATYQW